MAVILNLSGLWDWRRGKEQRLRNDHRSTSSLAIRDTRSEENELGMMAGLAGGMTSLRSEIVGMVVHAETMRQDRQDTHQTNISSSKQQTCALQWCLGQHATGLDDANELLTSIRGAMGWLAAVRLFDRHNRVDDLSCCKDDFLYSVLHTRRGVVKMHIQLVQHPLDGGALECQGGCCSPECLHRVECKQSHFF